MLGKATNTNFTSDPQMTSKMNLRHALFPMTPYFYTCVVYRCTCTVKKVYPLLCFNHFNTILYFKTSNPQMALKKWICDMRSSQWRSIFTVCIDRCTCPVKRAYTLLCVLVISTQFYTSKPILIHLKLLVYI